MSAEFRFDPDQIRRAIETAKEKLGGHMREVSESTVELAKENSPYDTGTNRRSITADYSDGNGVNTVGETVSASSNEGMPTGGDIGFRVYTQSGYGGWLEIGTKRMPARPYIGPAFTTSVNGLVEALEGCLD